jgi:phosphate:Na+ symporter
MVQTGIQRGFGPNLRHVMGAALGNRFKAFAAGLGITGLLQSSTATGLMTTSFVGSGFVALVPALAVMLGANVGTTLIVQLLSFDISAVAPAFILIGVTMFRKGAASRTRDLGRSLIGLGLLLLALGRLLEIVTPYEDMPSLRLLLGMIATAPLLDILLAAGITWAAHSSVAVVLIVMSFAAKGVIPPISAFALVLGANLGTAINPVLEGVQGRSPAARRLAIGNLLNRVIGCALVLPFLGVIGRALVVWEPDSAREVADFHTAFNLVTALLFFPFLVPYAKALEAMLPSSSDKLDPSRPIYLDETALETPSMALAAAAREALRMADALEAMLRSALEAVHQNDRGRVTETRQMDDTLDRLNTAVKDYVARLDNDDMSDEENRRAFAILAFITNIEHAGDVLDRNVMMLMGKSQKRGLLMSPSGRAEIVGMLERLIQNVRTAATVFMAADDRAARRLVEEKAAFREIETHATESHFNRLRSGRIDTAQTSSVHLDLVRDLKRINGHLVEGAAYPVLRHRGELLATRLKSV